MSTIYELPEIGENVVICTHLAVRDDAHLLYGFSTESEKAFRALLKINGVGTKMALVILSGMSASEFSNCVRSGNWSALVSLPGVGRKTAERLVLDMRDKVDRIFPDLSADEQKPNSTIVDDALAALVSLGYKQVDAEKFVDSLRGIFLPVRKLLASVKKCPCEMNVIYKIWLIGKG